jgi:hypothetical protein
MNNPNQPHPPRLAPAAADLLLEVMQGPASRPAT